MKKQIFAVVGSLLFLTACGDNGNGGGNSGAEINPLAKPSNPASAQYLAGVVEVLKKSGNIPSENVIFKKIIDNSEVKNISRDSAEYKNDFAKLNSVGRKFTEDIKNNCKIQDATKSERGTVAQGNTVVKTLTMGTSGQKCPYLVNKRNSQSTLYTQIAGDYNNAQLKAVSEFTAVNNFTINDLRVQKASAVKSMAMEFKMVLNLDISKTNDQMVSRAGGPITGQVNLVLANGDQITGPLDGSMSMTGAAEFDSKKADMVVRFTGKSPGGDIWFVMTSHQGKVEMFVNGEKMNLNTNRGLSLTDSVADELVESLKAL